MRNRGLPLWSWREGKGEEGGEGGDLLLVYTLLQAFARDLDEICALLQTKPMHQLMKSTTLVTQHH